MDRVEATVSSVTEVGARLGSVARACGTLLESAGRVQRVDRDRVDADVRDRQHRYEDAMAMERAAQAAHEACCAAEDCDSARTAAHLAECTSARQEAERRLDNARQALTIVDAAISRYAAKASQFSHAVVDQIPTAQARLAAFCAELSRYGAVAVGTTGSSGGAAVRVPLASPPPADSQTNVVVEVDELDSDGRVSGPAAFTKASYDDVRWGVEAQDRVVGPAVARGKTPAYFRQRDQAEGRSGSRSYSRVHEAFYGSSSIKVSPLPNGRYEVVNGEHRLFVARELGIKELPVRIVGSRT